MDSQTALELVKTCATLLFLDVPQHTLVAIDTQMFSVGPAFKGIKMIPPEMERSFHRLLDSSLTLALQSKWLDAIIVMIILTILMMAKMISELDWSMLANTHMFEHVIVRKWDQQEERLVKVSEEEEGRYSQAVKNMEFDQHLGPYSHSDYEDWKRLSNFITKSIIERLEPIGGEISVDCENDMFRNTPKTSMEEALDKQLKLGNSAKSIGTNQRKGCYYTSIPRVVKRKGISAQELTSLNHDKMGQSLEAFLQWKSLVSLLFGCTEAPFHTRTRLFTKFIKVIYYQLKYGLQKDRKDDTGPPLLDDSWLSTDSFLHYLCKDFFSLVLDGSVVDGDILKWFAPVVEMLDDEAHAV
ncbi:hypothetical protein TSUD_212190 [Trifolium subterraneum]|uniref:Uncharacterized protein n=1 Tax=Trifolium subterraneum TaxID=3900 RepID=A0A2Z6N294_TRISU|nr:hypothetical protein TSUD_212190 [Trifolium subterraneum]